MIGRTVVDLLSGMMSELVTTLRTENLVCDIYVSRLDSVRIIEFNPFGYWLATGSAFFHWLTDKALLYSEGGPVYFRVAY